MATIAYHLHTLFLFTKWDIKTTLGPIVICAVSAAPLASLWRVPHVLFWVWLHLLQFAVSNQTLDPAEDARNKAERPLPAGRIGLHAALVLRWALVPACMLHSAAYGAAVLCASAAVALLTIAYDEGGGHAGHWVVRNGINAAGLAAFEWGATLLAGADATRLAPDAVLAILLSAGVFLGTIHAQDFKDVHGDRLVGRKTLPILFPRHARKTVLASVFCWSAALAAVWELDALAAVLFVGLGAAVGVRFLVHTSMEEDQRSFYLYSVWLCCALALPGYRRISSGIAF